MAYVDWLGILAQEADHGVYITSLSPILGHILELSSWNWGIGYVEGYVCTYLTIGLSLLADTGFGWYYGFDRHEGRRRKCKS